MKHNFYFYAPDYESGKRPHKFVHPSLLAPSTIAECGAEYFYDNKPWAMDEDIWPIAIVVLDWNKKVLGEYEVIMDLEPVFAAVRAVPDK